MFDEMGSPGPQTAVSDMQRESYQSQRPPTSGLVYTSSPLTRPLWPDSVICMQVSRRLWCAAWTNRRGSLLMRTCVWPAAGPQTSSKPAVWIPAHQGNRHVACPAPQEHVRSWVRLSVGKTRMLIVTRCFENQLASVQTLSQIHLDLIKTRALESQPDGHAQGPEGSVHWSASHNVAGMCTCLTAAFSRGSVSWPQTSWSLPPCSLCPKPSQHRNMECRGLPGWYNWSPVNLYAKHADSL